LRSATAQHLHVGKPIRGNDIVKDHAESYVINLIHTLTILNVLTFALSQKCFYLLKSG